MAEQQSKYRTALRLYVHTAQVYKESLGEESFAYGWALSNIAYSEDVFGEYEVAANDCDKADGILAVTQDERFRVDELGTCALVAQHTNHLSRAEQRIIMAMEASKNMSDKNARSRIFAIASGIELELGHIDLAASYAEESLVLSRDLKDQERRTIDAKLALAKVAIAGKRYTEATVILDQIIPLAQSDPRRFTLVLIVLADAKELLGDYSAAAKAIDQAIITFQPLVDSTSPFLRQLRGKLVKLKARQ